MAHRFDVSCHLPQYLTRNTKSDDDEDDEDFLEENEGSPANVRRRVNGPMGSQAASSNISSPPPMLKALTVHKHNLVLPTHFNMTLAAAGVGAATYERSMGIPLHTNEFKRLRPHLLLYGDTYSINYVSNYMTRRTDLSH